MGRVLAAVIVLCHCLSGKDLILPQGLEKDTVTEAAMLSWQVVRFITQYGTSPEGCTRAWGTESLRYHFPRPELRRACHLTLEHKRAPWSASPW